MSLRESMIEELNLFGYSPYTKQSYVKAVEQLAVFHSKSPADINESEIKRFLIHKQKEGLASSSLTVIANGIRFIYKNVLCEDKIVENIPTIKVPRKLPTILSTSEVADIINAVTNLKQKTMLMLTYSVGLRLNELISLKLTDIDRNRMMIRVMGKGAKERYVGLSPIMLTQLEKYWFKYRTTDFLFASWDNVSPYSRRSVQNTFNTARIKAGIKKPGGPHLLRHAFATHLYESGTPLPVIQRLLGHSNIASTSIYIFVAENTVTSVKSPLDLLVLDKEAAHE